MIKGDIFFNPDDPIYKEHFPGNPVVPGSLVINGLYNESVKWHLSVKSPLKIRSFKFKKFLKPGKYKYCLKPNAIGISCSIIKDEEILVTGVIL